MQQVANETWVAYQRRLERAGVSPPQRPTTTVAALLSSAQLLRTSVH